MRERGPAPSVPPNMPRCAPGYNRTGWDGLKDETRQLGGFQGSFEMGPDVLGRLFGAAYPNRTDDLPLTRRLLYLLS